MPIFGGKDSKARVRKMGDTMIGMSKPDNFRTTLIEYRADELIQNYLRTMVVQETFPRIS